MENEQDLKSSLQHINQINKNLHERPSNINKDKLHLKVKEDSNKGKEAKRGREKGRAKVR